MALSIKSAEADRLARELTAATGESLTTAVVVALRERLERQRGRRSEAMSKRLTSLRTELRSARIVDSRTPEQIIGYDEHGLPQ